MDVYPRDIRAERDFVGFAAYQARFGQLIAGPITRWTHELQAQSVLAVDLTLALQPLEDQAYLRRDLHGTESGAEGQQLQPLLLLYVPQWVIWGLNERDLHAPLIEDDHTSHLND